MPAPAVTPALRVYDNTVVFRTFVARQSLVGNALANGAIEFICIAGWICGGWRSMAGKARMCQVCRMVLIRCRDLATKWECSKWAKLGLA